MRKKTDYVQRYTAFAAIVLMSLTAFTNQCHAQSDDMESTVGVFHVLHADIDNTFVALQTLLADQKGLKIAIDQRLGAIIARGSQATLQRVESLIESIDVVPAHRKNVIKMIDLEGRDEVGIAYLLKELRESVRVAVQPDQGIVISGSQVEVDSLMETLTQILDGSDPIVSSTTACVVRISWLVDPSSFQEVGLLYEPGSHLTELVTALGEQDSIKNGKLITSCQTVVQVKSNDSSLNGEFTTSSLRTYANGEFLRDVSVQAKGSVASFRDDKLLLELSMTVADGKYSIPINTTLSLPKNHPVAISVSNVGSFRSAFVVELLDSK